MPYETMLAEFERVLTKYGFAPERAHEAAEIFAQNSLAGVFSHGLNRFPRAVGYLRKGEIDPAAIEETRRMLPIGYWKGSGLSILLDMIATILTNANSVAKIGTQIMIAIDPAKFQSADVTDAIIDAIAADAASSEPAEPGREVRCPGLSEYRSRKENLELGIPVAEEKWAEVLAM